MRYWLVIVIPFAVCGQAANSSPAACVQAERATRVFLTDFENLDWRRFMGWFAEDATVYFPIPEPPRRFSGRAQIEAQFRHVFSAIRRSSKSGQPPFHLLRPGSLDCRAAGGKAALVSFVLENEERTARRTLLWQRLGGRWRITHLHASNVAK